MDNGKSEKESGVQRRARRVCTPTGAFTQSGAKRSPVRPRPFALSLLFLLCFSAGTHAQDYWLVLPRPTTHKLNKVVFIDSVRGWAAGDSGTIVYTENGGQVWTLQKTGIATEIFSLFMLNERLGWAVSPDFDTPGFQTTLLTTTNGGSLWTRRQLAEQLFYAVAFLDSLHGWMVGEFGGIVGTSDGGDNWFPAVVDTPYHPQWELSAIKFFTPRYGYAVGGRFDITGMVWRTTNGGETWHPTIAGGEPHYDIHFFDSLNVMCVGGDFDLGSGMIKTKDGGDSWSYQPLDIWGQARALGFRTAAEVWSPLGFASTYMYSPDSGRTWTGFPSPNGQALYDVTFPDSLHGYMVGNHGTVLKYNSSPLAVRENSPPAVPQPVRLFQNYPNPFNPTTIITYELADAGDVTLSVCDVIGREVRVLREGVKGRGTHTREFSAEGLASGVYYYRVSVRSGSGRAYSTRSMILLR